MLKKLDGFRIIPASRLNKSKSYEAYFAIVYLLEVPIDINSFPIERLIE